jgi:hypothetical protein
MPLDTPVYRAVGRLAVDLGPGEERSNRGPFPLHWTVWAPTGGHRSATDPASAESPDHGEQSPVAGLLEFLIGRDHRETRGDGGCGDAPVGGIRKQLAVDGHHGASDRRCRGDDEKRAVVLFEDREDVVAWSAVNGFLIFSAA